MKLVWRKSPENFQDALEIRVKVFVEEQGFHDEFDKIDDSCEHLILYMEDQAAGCARLYEEETGWHLGRVAVLPEYRGKGLGAEIVREAERKAIELGAAKLGLSAQMRAQKFYEKLGYCVVTEPYLDEYCPHVGMEKVLNHE